MERRSNSLGSVSSQGALYPLGYEEVPQKKLKVERPFPPDPFPEGVWIHIARFVGSREDYLAVRLACRFFRDTLPPPRCHVGKGELSYLLGQRLSYYPHLEVLDLSGRQLNPIFFKSLKSENLKELVLRQCKGLNGELFKAIGGGCENLKRLVVSYSEVEGGALIELALSLVHLERLEVVDCPGMVDLLPELHEKCPRLWVSLMWGSYYRDNPSLWKIDLMVVDPSQSLNLPSLPESLSQNG